MRSKLFVPATRPELFAKAVASAADAISIDLEDAVHETRKAAARVATAALLQTDEAHRLAKLLIVRVNALGTPHFEADLAAVVVSSLSLINLPKVGSAADVLAAVRSIERAELANRIQQPVRLLITIETPRALRLAAEIACAHPRVAGLQLGLADLFEPLRIDRRDSAALHAALLAVRLAAGEAGIFACDAAFPDMDDSEGFRREAETARRLGFVGKSCIHPDQIAIANDVFRASNQEIASARRVVEAARVAAARGSGVFVVDGMMIDLPYLKRAQALVAAAGE